MDELLWVIGKHDSFERMLMYRKIYKAAVRRIGNGDCTLLSVALKSDDNVLLQNVVILESLGPGSEHMYVLYRGVVEQKVSEWSIIRPVAKAARDNRHKLAARCHQGKR